MPLIRGFLRVDKQGKISIPSNITRKLRIKPGQLVEIKVTGPNKGPYVIINKREYPR